MAWWGGRLVGLASDDLEKEARRMGAPVTVFRKGIGDQVNVDFTLSELGTTLAHFAR